MLCDFLPGGNNKIENDLAQKNSAKDFEKLPEKPAIQYVKTPALQKAETKGPCRPSWVQTRLILQLKRSCRQGS